jgi:hypothetical protein
MIIDCERCEVRAIACGDCVVGVLLGVPAVPRGGARPARPPGSADGPPGPPGVQLEPAERRALQVLADQGLVPRLRLVEGGHRQPARPADLPYPTREVG